MAKDRPPRASQQAAPQHAAPIATRLEQALAFHAKGQLARAESVYREILAQVPTHCDALHFLGVLQYQKGQYESAVELIGRAIKIDSTRAVPLLNMGLALHGLQRPQEALASYERALTL